MFSLTYIVSVNLHLANLFCFVNFAEFSRGNYLLYIYQIDYDVTLNG